MYCTKGQSGRFSVFNECSSDVVDALYQFYRLPLRKDLYDIGNINPIELSKIISEHFHVELNLGFTAFSLHKFRSRNLLFDVKLKRRSSLDEINHKTGRSCIFFGSAKDFYGIESNWLHYIFIGFDGYADHYYDGFSYIYHEYTEKEFPGPIPTLDLWLNSSAILVMRQK